jgi:hypothetical protein
MMNPARLLIPVATFAIGYAAAWSAKPDVPPAATADALVQTRAAPRAVDRVRPARNPADPGIHKRLDELLEKKVVSQRTGQGNLDISEQDYPRLLKALAERAGMTGLDRDQERLMEKLVVDWYQASPDAALDWVLGLKSEKDTSKLLSGIMASLFEKDWKDGVAFAEQYGAAEGRDLEMPYGMIDGLGKLDASSLLRVIDTFPSRSGGISGRPVNFSSDFDFCQALDGLSERLEKFPKGTRMAFIPSNLLSEWAKRDFDSALQWARSRKEVPLNPIGDAFKTKAATVGVDEFAGIVVQLMNEPNQDQEKAHRMAWDIMKQSPNPELVGSVLRQLSGNRQEHLSQMLATSFLGQGSIYETFQESVLSQMTAAERIGAFQSEAVKKIGPYFEFSSMTPMLLRLGHTQQEIDQMVSAASLPK